MSQKSQSIVCVQGISIRLNSMPIISFSPSPPLPPPCFAPHCSAPPHPVIPQERREGKTHEEGVKERIRGAKGFEKVEGGVGGCGCCTQEGALCLDFASDRFVYLLSFVHVCLCPSRRVHQRSVQSAPNLAWAPATSSVVKERHLAVAAALWAHFFPFLRSLRLSQTPPAQLADAAAGQ